MRWMLAAVVVTTGLAGCLGGASSDASPATGAQAASVDGAPDQGPVAPTANETNVTLFDPWLPGEGERLLFDGTVEVFPTCGCGSIALPDDTLIPLGTAALRVETDASQALRGGTYYVYLYTRHRNTDVEADMPPSSVAVRTWEIPLVPGDWDAPWQTSSVADLGYWSQHTDENGLPDSWALFFGPVPTKVVAVRDPDWSPAPARPATRLLDWNGTWSQPSLPNLALGAGVGEALALAAIPEDTAEITVAASWTERTCPSGHDCAPNPALVFDGEWIYGFAVERIGTYRLQSFLVPGDVPADPAGETESATYLDPFVWKCDESELNPLPCFASFYAYDAAVDLRVVVDAWPGQADGAALRAELGVA